MSEELRIGIQWLSEGQKRSYFKGLEGEHGHLLGYTIGWDEQYLRENAISIDGLNTFLLGGCGSILSLAAMRDFISEIRGVRPTKLIVTDLEKIAVKQIRPMSNEVLFTSDLLNPPIVSGSVDYIRLDFLQNFIYPEKQLMLLRSLKRIVSGTGIISSVLYMVPVATKKLGEEIEGGKFNRSRIFSSNNEEANNFNYFCLSREFLTRMCDQAGLRLTFCSQQTEEFEGGALNRQQVVMQR